MLTCADLAQPPAWVPPWSSGGEMQWWLARAWDVGAVVAIVARGAQLLV
ncbi:hypothetical protein [Sorangium sp. So ce131]